MTLSQIRTALFGQDDFPEARIDRTTLCNMHAALSQAIENAYDNGDEDFDFDEAECLRESLTDIIDPEFTVHWSVPK